MNTQENHWQPVLPRITDPNLAPEDEEVYAKGGFTGPSFAGGAAGTAISGGAGAALTRSAVVMEFFSTHKIKIIVAVVILLIALIILYMYITTKAKSNVAEQKLNDTTATLKGGGTGGAGTSGVGAGTKSGEPSLDELNRVKELRRQAKQLADMNSNNKAAAAAGLGAPNAVQNGVQNAVQNGVQNSPLGTPSTPTPGTFGITKAPTTAFKFTPNPPRFTTPPLQSAAPESKPQLSLAPQPSPKSVAHQSSDTHSTDNNVDNNADDKPMDTIFESVVSTSDEDVDNLVNELADSVVSFDMGDVEE